MAKRDYYETLGVSSDVSEGELKKAYRRLAMKCHPDRNPGDAEAEVKFKELSEAYEVLSDSEKRAAYDRYGHDAFEGGMGGPGGGFHGGGASFSDIFGDVFGDIFGGAGPGGAGRSSVHRGSDLRYTLDLTLEEAVFGIEKTIRVPGLPNVILATAVVQSLVHLPRLARPVTARVRSGCSKVSLRFSRPARDARARVKSLQIHAVIAEDRVGRKRPRHCL